MIITLAFLLPQLQEQRRERENYMSRKRVYATQFMFLTHDDVGEVTSVGIWNSNNLRKTEREQVLGMVLVHSEEEAKAYLNNNNVAAAWPGFFADDGVIALNNAIRFARNAGHEVIIPSNLSEPIEVADLVDYWAEVDELFHDLQTGMLTNRAVLEVFRGRESLVPSINP